MALLVLNEREREREGEGGRGRRREGGRERERGREPSLWVREVKGFGGGGSLKCTSCSVTAATV